MTGFSYLGGAMLGLGVGFRRDKRITALLLSTVLYYLLSLSFMHSELRYGLPMHSVLLVFGGLALMWLAGMVRAFRKG